MQEHTDDPGNGARDGEIIVAVTILRTDRAADTPSSPPRVVARTSEFPLETLRDGSLSGLEEAVRKALGQAGRPQATHDLECATAGLPSDWELLIEARLRCRPHDLYAEILAVMERHLLTRVLDHVEGNQSRAARILGISRGCLRDKIRTLGIMIGHSVRLESDQIDRQAATHVKQEARH